MFLALIRYRFGGVERGSEMTNTMLEYLQEYGNRSFREMPLNEVDSLILCQLSYLKFDGLVPDVNENRPSVTLASLKKHKDYEKLFADVRYADVNRALIEGMIGSVRFQNTKLNCYVNFIKQENETQFSAITFFLDDGTVYIAFRGTDETIVGWKEDFNMAFLAPVPGQEYSVRYLNIVASMLQRPFYVGGHSKGGNLAVYSSMHCKPAFQDRIIKIYSMDGPGLRPEIMESGNYEMIASRVVKILPHSSMIGMIFESDPRYEVIESKSFGLMQHDPYSWVVEDSHLKRVEGIYQASLKVDKTINSWLLTQNEEQLKVFVDTLYQVISASDTDNLIDLTADWQHSVTGMLGALRDIDEETGAVLKKLFKALIDLAAEGMKQDMIHSTRQLIDDTKAFILQKQKKNNKLPKKPE